VGDLLSQEEVNALLSAVGEGEAVLEEELDSAPGTRADVTLYDFKRPNRVSRDQLRSMQTLHETFTREFAGTLSAQLRSVVEIDVISVEQLTYLEYVMSLPSPTNLYVFSIDPLEGRGVFEVNPSLALAVIERLFGGSGVVSSETRNLTNIEQRVMSKIVARALSDLSETWKRLLAVDFKLLEAQSNPQYVQLVPPSETIITVSLEMRLQHGSGLMSLCYPYVFLEPAIAKLSGDAMVAFRARKASPETVQAIAAGISETPVEVAVVLGGGSVSVSDFLTLREGDVIKLDTKLGSPAVILVDGRPKFLGAVGASGRHRAVKVLSFTEGGGETNGGETANGGV